MGDGRTYKNRLETLLCNGNLVSNELITCHRFLCQLLGWHAFTRMWTGVLFIPTSFGVHTYGMKFPLTGVWIAKDFRVIGCIVLTANTYYLAPKGSLGLLECSGSALDGVEIEDRIEMRVPV